MGNCALTQINTVHTCTVCGFTYRSQPAAAVRISLALSHDQLPPDSPRLIFSALAIGNDTTVHACHNDEGICRNSRYNPHYNKGDDLATRYTGLDRLHRNHFEYVVPPTTSYVVIRVNPFDWPLDRPRVRTTNVVTDILPTFRLASCSAVTFEPICLINHIGPRPDSGHYTTTVKHYQQWYLLNDMASPNQCVRLGTRLPSMRNVYLLFARVVHDDD